MTSTVEKWPPLDPGTRVRTSSRKTADKEWTPEALVARKWGVTGKIIMHHDSHGLCYDVRHDDGTEGCYDPTEFDVLQAIKLENVVIRGEVLVDGEARPKILIDIMTPKDGLFLVTVDSDGKEISRIPVPTNAGEHKVEKCGNCGVSRSIQHFCIGELKSQVQGLRSLLSRSEQEEAKLTADVERLNGNRIALSDSLETALEQRDKAYSEKDDAVLQIETLKTVVAQDATQIAAHFDRANVAERLNGELRKKMLWMCLMRSSNCHLPECENCKQTEKRNDARTEELKAALERGITHCDGSHCAYTVKRLCHCACPKCGAAKTRDH